MSLGGLDLLSAEAGLLCANWTGPLSGPEAPEEASPFPRTKATGVAWRPGSISEHEASVESRPSHLCGQVLGLCCPCGALQTQPSFITGQLWDRPQFPWQVFFKWKSRQKGVPLGADVAQVDGQVGLDLPLSLDLDLPLPLVEEVIDLGEPLVH